MDLIAAEGAIAPEDAAAPPDLPLLPSTSVEDKPVFDIGPSLPLPLLPNGR